MSIQVEILEKLENNTTSATHTDTHIHISIESIFRFIIFSVFSHLFTFSCAFNFCPLCLNHLVESYHCHDVYVRDALLSENYVFLLRKLSVKRVVFASSFFLLSIFSVVNDFDLVKRRGIDVYE